MDEMLQNAVDDALLHCKAVLALLVYRAERELGLIEVPTETITHTLRRK